MKYRESVLVFFMHDCHWDTILVQNDCHQQCMPWEKNKTLQCLWVIITFLPIVFFSDQFLVTILVLLVTLNFHFPYFKFSKLVSDGVESNPGPNINGIGIYENCKYEIIDLKESFFTICYSAQK